MRDWLIRSVAMGAGLIAALFASLAHAHPHVWVTASAEILYNPDGAAAAVRHVWEFDEGYSSFAVQGLAAKDGTLGRAELAALAQENAESLHEFEFFTRLKIDGKLQSFGQPKDYYMEMNGPLLRFVYTLPLAAPLKPRTSLSLEITDSTFFVAFNLADKDDAVRLVGAPQGCTVKISRPKTQAPQQSLSEQAFNALRGSSEDIGLQFAPKALVACP